MSAADSVSQRTGMLVVQQLSHAQWHAFDPETTWTTGAVGWVEAVDRALWAGMLTGSGIESVDLNYNRIVLLHPELRT